MVENQGFQASGPLQPISNANTGLAADVSEGDVCASSLAGLSLSSQVRYLEVFKSDQRRVRATRPFWTVVLHLSASFTSVRASSESPVLITIGSPLPLPRSKWQTRREGMTMTLSWERRMARASVRRVQQNQLDTRLRHPHLLRTIRCAPSPIFCCSSGLLTRSQTDTSRAIVLCELDSDDSD